MVLKEVDPRLARPPRAAATLQAAREQVEIWNELVSWLIGLVVFLT